MLHKTKVQNVPLLQVGGRIENKRSVFILDLTKRAREETILNSNNINLHPERYQAVKSTPLVVCESRSSPFTETPVKFWLSQTAWSTLFPRLHYKSSFLPAPFYSQTQSFYLRLSQCISTEPKWTAYYVDLLHSSLCCCTIIQETIQISLPLGFIFRYKLKF